MRIRLVALAALLALAAPALASDGGLQHESPQGNGTHFPTPEESTERGPIWNGPVSWFQASIAVLFLVLAGSALLYMRRASRQDRRR